MERYEVCVIGGGPSGYAAAMRAVDFGKKVDSAYRIAMDAVGEGA